MSTAGGTNASDRGVFTPAHRRPEMDAVETAVISALERRNYPDAARFAVRLALEEAMVNAFQHGHRGLPESTPLSIEYEITNDRVTLRVKDQGPGFTPVAVPDPTADENLELPSGRGLMLMRAFMTSVEHDEGGTRVTLVYDRPAE